METFIAGLIVGGSLVWWVYSRAIHRWAKVKYGQTWRRTGDWPRLRDVFG